MTATLNPDHSSGDQDSAAALTGASVASHACTKRQGKGVGLKRTSARIGQNPEYGTPDLSTST
eukprot:5827125-Pleurochrysis_carterae.AAC.2